MKFSRVCGVQRVMAKGGATEGIMPPLVLGVGPEVPIRGFTWSRMLGEVWLVGGERKGRVAKVRARILLGERREDN